LIAARALPGEREPGGVGKLPEEGPLRPPVTLAERMQGVELAQVTGQPPDERATAQAAQAVFIVQLAEDDGAEESIYRSRQNMAPLPMATVRICPAHWVMSPGSLKRGGGAEPAGWPARHARTRIRPAPEAGQRVSLSFAPWVMLLLTRPYR
jgi:hypothetical protein